MLADLALAFAVLLYQLEATQESPKQNTETVDLITGQTVDPETRQDADVSQTPRAVPWKMYTDIDLDLVVSGTTNAQPFAEDLPRAQDVIAGAGAAGGGIWFEKEMDIAPKPDDRLRFLDVGLTLDASGTVQNRLHEIEPLEQIGQFHVSGDCRVRGSSRLSVGGTIGRSSLDIDGRPFADSTFGALIVRTMNDLERRKVLGDGSEVVRKGCLLHDAYGEFESFDDNETPDGSVDSRDGNYKSYGMEGTFYSDTRKGCPRLSPFQRSVPLDHWTIEYGYEYRTHATDGTEFGFRGHRIHLGGHLRLGDSMTMDWRTDGTWNDYRNESRFEPNEERNDDTIDVELAFNPRFKRGFLKNFCSARGDAGENFIGKRDCRIGISYTRQQSNIPVFRYERWAVFVGLRTLYTTRTSFAIEDTASGGSRVKRRTSGSGSSQVQVVDELPDE